MKPSVSKTVHVDKRPSFAGNLVTIFAGRAERTAETTAMRQNLPGKSHVGRILLNDNTSQERLLDMRLSDIHNAQRKTANFIAHQKKTFMNRMEHRQSTWVREHSRRANILNSLTSRKRDSVSKTAKSQDREEGEEEVTEQIDSEDAKGKSYSNHKIMDTKVKCTPHERTDALPEINSAQSKTRLQRGIGNIARGTKSHNKSEDQTGLFLPSIQKSKTTVTNSAVGTHLPSVLITAERDTDPTNQETTPRSAGSSTGKTSKKKPRRSHEAFEQLRLTGPSPTFISEVLPRIQIQECVRIPAHLSNKSRRRRRKRSLSKSCEGDPLADDRFLRLQHTLAPHLALKESRDMAGITAGVVNAKKPMAEKLRKISRVDGGL